MFLIEQDDRESWVFPAPDLHWEPDFVDFVQFAKFLFWSWQTLF